MTFRGGVLTELLGGLGCADMPEPLREFIPKLEPGWDAFDVQRATVSDGGFGIFVLKSQRPLAMMMAERFKKHWEAIWRRTGIAAAPPLLILDNGLDLGAFNDASLADLDLMRIRNSE